MTRQSSDDDSVEISVNGNKCLIDDCNYKTGELAIKEWANSGTADLGKATTMSRSTAITTTVYINTTTQLTYTSVVSGLHQHQSVTPRNMDQPNIPQYKKDTVQLMTTPLPLPATMDIPTMFQMLSDISAQVATANRETIAMRSDMTTYDKKIQDVSQEVEDHNQLIKETVVNFNKCVDTVQLLAGFAIKQEKEIEKIKTKLESMEAATNRNKLVISGIEEVEGENVTHSVLTFLKAKLLIDQTIQISAAKRLGPISKDKPARPIELTLTDRNDKGVIYKHTKNLKGTKNSYDMSYQVCDVLPEKLQEEDNRRRQMIGQNRYKAKKNTAHNIAMSLKKNQLLINNNPYRKKVPEPQCGDLLMMNDEERDAVQGARLAATEEYSEKDNRFKAYLLETGEINEVRTVYKHIRIKHADATHITVAYNLDNINLEFSDYVDNGKIGAGSRLLKAMTDCKIVNSAIYLVRYHSGQNLGPRRFQVFKEMANKALDIKDECENFFASRLQKPKLAIKSTRSLRTRGRMTGVRGGAHSNRARAAPEDVSDSWCSMIDDSEAEIVINHRRKSNNNKGKRP